MDDDSSYLLNESEDEEILKHYILSDNQLRRMHRLIHTLRFLTVSWPITLILGAALALISLCISGDSDEASLSVL